MVLLVLDSLGREAEVRVVSEKEKIIPKYESNKDNIFCK